MRLLATVLHTDATPAASFVGTAGLKLWVDCGPFGSVVAANVFVGA